MVCTTTVHIAVRDWSGMSDLIKRQDAVDAVFELSDKLANEMLFIDAIVDKIENLPSIELERKKGEWISHENYDECSKCHCFTSVGFNYCPHCGAEMINEDFYMKLEGAEHE